MAYNVNDTLNELTDAFKYFNKYLFANRLPEPVLIIQSKRAGARNAMGWFTLGKNWVDRETGTRHHEITVCAETLNKPINTILAVLVHEMVHLDNKMREIADCSAGQYHNKNFKKAAESALLVCKYTPKYGYGITEPSPQLQELFDLLPIDHDAFNLASADEKFTPQKKYFMYSYRCSGCGITFKTRANLAPGTICGTCGGCINMEKENNG